MTPGQRTRMLKELAAYILLFGAAGMFAVLVA